jgi:hypothetical protein
VPDITHPVSRLRVPATVHGEHSRAVSSITAEAQIIVTVFETARRWREENGYVGPGGMVVLLGDEVQSWVNTLRNPEHWQPGCVAIDEEGRTWTTVVGSERHGALMWLAGHEL